MELVDRMDWTKLLNDGRRKSRGKAKPRKPGEQRVEHERDHDRILFSTPVRRLQDKTQVFPLEPNDSVRTRLTHSHEVANLARSIGTTLVFEHAEALGIPETLQPKRSVPALLEAIGLAHDLGNPPFGHQGEAAIQSWMLKHSAPKSPDSGSFGIFDGAGAELTKSQRLDFLKFEGNAQAFRLLTRLQVINDNFGLDMTYAFLAALMKYPVPSDKADKTSQARKKFNFFQSERDIAAEVWEETGLGEGIRHPLTFIMEACDDIAYSVVDIEDAAKKGFLSLYDLLAYLEHEAGGDELVRDLCASARERDKKYRDLSLSAGELDDISMQMLRVRAIGALVPAATRVFVQHKDAILSGTFDNDLLAVSDGRVLWKALKEFAKAHVYKHRSVLEVELKGHQTIHALMDMFWQAIRDRADEYDLASKRPPYSQYVYNRISENYRRIAEDSDNGMPIRYRELQLITDMISGMSDSYAISLREELERLRG